MNISVLCVTYGRVDKLQEMLASFLNQQTSATKELIILNTYSDQNLVYNHPEVRIVNLINRPKTLGDCRNQAVMWSNYDRLITVDDDDLILPYHVENYARLFGKNDWIMPDGYIFTTSKETFYKEGAIPAALGYTLKAFARAGGYSSMNSGEDQDFNHKIMTNSDGEVKLLKKSEMSYVYNWDNGIYHVSGASDDEGLNGYDKVARHTENMRKDGLIPTGRIVLRPEVSDRYYRVLNSPIAQ